MSSPFDFLNGLFSSDGFLPRRVCGLWPDWLVWEHVAGNGSIWLAYLAMPVLIWRLGNLRLEWRPFAGLIRAFALFIVLCGVGHFLDMLAFFHPMYRFSGHVLIVTGVASWWTVWSLRQSWPSLMAMKSPAQLEQVIAERTEELAVANLDLRKSDADVRLLNEGLEHRVSERTAELASAIEGLQREAQERRRAEFKLRRGDEQFRTSSGWLAPMGIDSGLTSGGTTTPARPWSNCRDRGGSQSTTLPNFRESWSPSRRPT